MKMLFDLPAQLFVTPEEQATLKRLSEIQLTSENQKPKRVLKLTEGGNGASPRRSRSRGIIAHPQWLDVPKYAVRVVSNSAAR
jgi:hypothetical protein